MDKVIRPPVELPSGKKRMAPRASLSTSDRAVNKATGLFSDLQQSTNEFRQNVCFLERTCEPLTLAHALGYRVDCGSDCLIGNDLSGNID